MNDWLAAHGIDPEVWRERGVWRYDKGDPRVKDEFRGSLPKTKLGTVTKVVNQSAGILMPKHPPSTFPLISPQLRPDDPVVVDSRELWHYDGPIGGDWPVFPPEAPGAGKFLPRKLVLSLYPTSAEMHVKKGKVGDPDYDPETGLGYHKDINLDFVHRHAPESAKYIILGEDEGKRLDLHPRALELLPQRERVFFVLEGTPKNDAVLSAGEAVFSVPSVTLWRPSELRAFVRLMRLGEKTVFVVPDADWFQNPLVEQQALFVRTLLRYCGVFANIAAPPVRDGQEECRCKPVGHFLNGACIWCGGFAKGVDDHLAGGGTIDGLAIRHFEAPLSILRLKFGHPSTTKRAQKASEGLILHADKAGKHCRSLGALAKIMGVDKRRVTDTLCDLKRLQAIRVDGSLEVETLEWKGVKVREWEERPTVVIHPEFRALERTAVLLGDFWQRETRKLDDANVKLQQDVTEIKEALGKLVPED